jgi:hypothetical protein
MTSFMRCSAGIQESATPFSSMARKPPSQPYVVHDICIGAPVPKKIDLRSLRRTSELISMSRQVDNDRIQILAVKVYAITTTAIGVIAATRSVIFTTAGRHPLQFQRSIHHHR